MPVWVDGPRATRFGSFAQGSAPEPSQNKSSNELHGQRRVSLRISFINCFPLPGTSRPPPPADRSCSVSTSRRSAMGQVVGGLAGVTKFRLDGVRTISSRGGHTAAVSDNTSRQAQFETCLFDACSWCRLWRPSSRGALAFLECSSAATNPYMYIKPLWLPGFITIRPG